jgi:hypothetical protein
MLRDNLAGLIEPMIDCAGVHALGGHPKSGLTGGCSRSTRLAIVALKRSLRHMFRWKTRRQVERATSPGFELTTVAHGLCAVGTTQHTNHRTIDPQCLENPRPAGAESTLTDNAASPFHAEPRHLSARSRPRLGGLKPYNFGIRINDAQRVPFVRGREPHDASTSPGDSDDAIPPRRRGG